MWYEHLVKELFIPKVNKAKQIEAAKFLDLFFQKYRRTSGETIPPLALLGLIYKLHKRYDSLGNETLTLTQFSREFIGLSIILMKASFDEAIWNVDFKLDIPEIKDALNLLPFNSANTPESKVIPEWEDVQFPADINHIQKFTVQLRFLEAQAFRALDYNLSLDYDYLLPIMIKNRAIIFPELLEYYTEGFAGKSDLFDEFIYKLKLTIIAYQYIEQGNLQGFQDLLNAEPNKIAEITLEWELTLGSSKHITSALISRAIQNLNSEENRTTFITEALGNNQPAIANFLRANSLTSENESTKILPQSETHIENKKPLLLTFTKIDQLIKNCEELFKSRIISRVEQFPAGQNELWQLLKEINAQLSDEEKTDTNWQKITLEKLCRLCKAHKIQVISELDGSVFDATLLHEHNLSTPLQDSLSEGFNPILKQKKPSLTQLGIFSPAKTEIEPLSNLQESLLRGFL